MTLEEALREAIRIAQRHICLHETRHRGGIIWEICDDCGASWADDRGGYKEDPDIKRLEELETLMPTKKPKAKKQALSDKPNRPALIPITCVCGTPITLQLTRPDMRNTVWWKYCTECKRHIRLMVSHDG